MLIAIVFGIIITPNSRLVGSPVGRNNAIQPLGVNARQPGSVRRQQTSKVKAMWFKDESVPQKPDLSPISTDMLNAMGNYKSLLAEVGTVNDLDAAIIKSFIQNNGYSTIKEELSTPSITIILKYINNRSVSKNLQSALKLLIEKHGNLELAIENCKDKDKAIILNYMDIFKNDNPELPAVVEDTPNEFTKFGKLSKATYNVVLEYSERPEVSDGMDSKIANNIEYGYRQYK